MWTEALEKIVIKIWKKSFQNPNDNSPPCVSNTGFTKLYGKLPFEDVGAIISKMLSSE